MGWGAWGAAVVFGIAMTIGSVGAQDGEPEFHVAWTEESATSIIDDESPWWDAHRFRFGPALYETEFRALWNAEGLYVRFDATDTNPWFTMTNRDDRIWQEEVVEIFIDLDRSGTNYAEIEINPNNVVTDLRMLRGVPDIEGDIEWDLDGLESHVRLNKYRDGSTAGWTAVAVLPWAGFQTLPSAETIAVPPAPADRWRFNVFRIKRPGGPQRPTQDVVFASWSPITGESFHEPAVFRDLIFDPSTEG
tara:strand:- start:2472 stop:3215 length:744 start_codon:yes stop_codon:yes gene_type:complete